MSVCEWCLRSDSAVAMTGSRQLGRSWKSSLGCIPVHSMRPMSSGSYTSASGSRRCSSCASVVFPAANPPLSQMITVASIRVVRDTTTFIRHIPELRLRPVARTRLGDRTE